MNYLFSIDYRINQLIKTFSLIILIFISPIFVDADSTEVNIPQTTNYANTLHNDILKTLPFRGENNLYYTLFPGVTSQDFRGDDLLHIRGSRHDELAYYINGIDIRSDFSGTPLFRIIPQALNNISIDKSPSVAISSARAAVTHQLRRGGDDYTFSINGETDKFTPLYEQRLDTYSYGYNNLTLTGGGTIPTLNTKFFLAGERENFADHYRMFWDGFSLTKPEFDLTFITNQKYTEVDTGYIYTYDIIDNIDELTVKPGNIPEAKSGRTTFNGIITQPFPGGSVSLVSLYEDETKRINNTPIYHMFNQKRLPETNRNTRLYSLQGEYNFPNDIKLNLQADFLRSKQSTYDPIFGDDFWKYSDSIALANKGIPYVSGYWYMELHNFPFHKEGRAITGYSKQNENYYNFTFDISKSFKNHTIRLGSNYKKSEYRFFSVSPYIMRSLQQYMQFNGFDSRGDIPHNALENFLFWGRVQGVGYNLMGDAITDEGLYFDAPIQPKQSSIYISDIITKGDWTAEIGLRYDSFYSDMLYYKDSTFLDRYSYNYWTELAEYKVGLTKQEKNTSWSPRIEIKHQTNAKLISYLKLGKYMRFPQYQNIFIDKYYRTLYSTGSGIYNNDPRAWNANFVTSYQASYGLDYLLNRHTRVTVEFYEVSSKNCLQSGTKGLSYNYSAQLGDYLDYAEYPTLLNGGSAISRGLELSLNYGDKNIDAWVNYNYSSVKGTSTYPISNLVFTHPDYWWRDSTEFSPTKRNLDYNNQHSAVGFLAYKYGDDRNLIFKNMTISMLGRFDSGHPYTLWEAGWDAGILYEGALPSHENMRHLHDPTYGNTTPWRLTVDLRVDKTINIGKTGELTIYAYAQNIFNRKNINHVHWKSGNTVDDGSSENFEFHRENWDWFDDFYTLYELINLEHRQHYRDREGGDLFGRPREIRFGISFSY